MKWSWNSYNTINGANFVDRLFTETGVVIQESKISSVAASVCLHETGHLLIARSLGLTIENATMPTIDSFFDPSGPLPEVRVARIGINPEHLCDFLLAGLFGEMSPYSDAFICAHFCNLRIGVYGAGDDMRGAATLSKNMPFSNEILNALSASREGADRENFLRRFPFYQLPAFKRFRAHKADHQFLASKVYAKWEDSGFGPIDFKAI